MLIANHMPDADNHLRAIADCFEKAEKADIVVAYIQQGGVALLQNSLDRIGHAVRLICSLDMDVTDPSALKALMVKGVKVKIYRMGRVTMHAKLWLFQDARGCWRCIVGSANLSAGGLRNNVEAGVGLTESENPDALAQARNFFGVLWNSERCSELTGRDIDAWISGRRERREMIARIRRLQNQAKPLSDSARVNVLRKFVKGWIDIGVHEKTAGAGVTGKMWRGWYIIPDQGYIDHALMNRLHRICQIMLRAGGVIDISKSVQPPLDEILEITTEKLQRPKHKMNPRDLFIRQEKNYLVHFEFARNPAKNNGRPDIKTLVLTEYGAQFAGAASAQEQKRIYTASMQQYAYNGLPLLKFTRKLLDEADKIDLTEFSYFANHAYSIGEVNNIAALIRMYRHLPGARKTSFEEEMNDYFRAKLEHTATNVRGNYDKSAKHTMSALGWCEGLHCDFENWELSLSDEQRKNRVRANNQRRIFAGK
ncbi:MAG: phospholipase D-like domain-containing protein [Gammaproteobacteria bacterium]|nr:phospholipase D-like domain-containing protein [Gammaproteobacteria bacterium]